MILVDYLFNRPPCPKCGKTIADGQRIELIFRGTINPTGGVGRYADMPVLKDITRVLQHQECGE